MTLRFGPRFRLFSRKWFEIGSNEWYQCTNPLNIIFQKIGALNVKKTRKTTIFLIFLSGYNTARAEKHISILRLTTEKFT